MKFRINVAIFGATGYTGLELIRLLNFHKKAEIKYLISTSNYGKNISELYPGLNSVNYPKLIKFKEVNWKNIDVIFLCLPSGESKRIVKKIPKSIVIIDLSNDFRVNSLSSLKSSDSTWKYGLADNWQNFLELDKEHAYGTKISNPGCYATSILSPLIPLLLNKLIQSSDIIIDSKSGISGAGKQNLAENLFSEISNSIRPYKIAKHKHIQEIEACLSKFNNHKKLTISFTPQVIPINRGILSNIYLKLEKGKTINDVKRYFQKEISPFLKILKSNQIPSINDVVGTNYCLFNVFQDRIKKRIIIISVVDNLVKGAAGQAIQNMNIKYGFDQEEGLIFSPVFP